MGGNHCSLGYQLNQYISNQVRLHGYQQYRANRKLIHCGSVLILWAKAIVLILAELVLPAF